MADASPNTVAHGYRDAEVHMIGQGMRHECTAASQVRLTRIDG
jgi:hypothetical protein